MHHALILELRKLLLNLDACLQKATEHAAAKKYDVNVLLQARLAPDMFPLVRQIQAACDSAKFVAARLAGQDAPSHPDTEQTMDEARARIGKVVAYLDSFTADDLAESDRRVISLPRWEGKSMTGTGYLVEYGVPNTIFHVVTAYGILRHNGVDIGKRDYLGALSMR